MKNSERDALRRRLSSELSNASARISMPGISNSKAKDVLVLQLIDSMRRVGFFIQIKDKNYSQGCSDPNGVTFDPIKAAVFMKNSNNFDEACWLVFLSIFFGKHKKSGWESCRRLYAGDSKSGVWDWAKVSSNPAKLSVWLGKNHNQFPSAFSNHRKYESVDPSKKAFAGKTIISYVNWVGKPASHQNRFNKLCSKSDGTMESKFDEFYKSLDDVYRFGRMTKFDFLTSLGKLELMDIEPGRVYMDGATGPRTGSNRLFFNNRKKNTPTKDLDNLLAQLLTFVDLGPMKMQVLEDAICNWDKNPTSYSKFSG